MGVRRSIFSRVWAFAGLFSGVALVAHIVSGVSLRLGLALTTSVMLLSGGLVWRRALPTERTRVARVIRIGLLAGILATTAYDAAKFALSLLDPSPYNPFEAIRVFGVLLAGQSAAPLFLYAAGTAFHLVNGMSFGVVYCVLFGRRGVPGGIIWGVFLEVFQLTLYPGWLDIRAYREFAQISALSHIVYGATLGFLCKRAWQTGDL